MDAIGRSNAGERAFSRYVVGRERMVLTTRKHVATLAEPVLTAAVSFVAAGWLMWRFEPTLGDGVLVLGLIWLAVLARCVFYVVEWRHNWFGWTDKRLLLQTGLVIRKVTMMPLEKVTDLSYRRSVPGRLLGYGQFVLEFAGRDQALHTITFIPHPDDTYRLLVTTIFGRGQSDDSDGSGEVVRQGARGDESLPPSFLPARRTPARGTPARRTPAMGTPIGDSPELPTWVVPFVDPIRLHADPWESAYRTGDGVVGLGASGVDGSAS